MLSTISVLLQTLTINIIYIFIFGSVCSNHLICRLVYRVKGRGEVATATRTSKQSEYNIVKFRILGILTFQ